MTKAIEHYALDFPLMDEGAEANTRAYLDGVTCDMRHDTTLDVVPVKPKPRPKPGYDMHDTTPAVPADVAAFNTFVKFMRGAMWVARWSFGAVLSLIFFGVIIYVLWRLGWIGSGDYY